MIEPAVCDAGGTIVKRLGDGVMAVFDDAAAAVPALHDACARVEELERRATRRACGPGCTSAARAA